MFRKLELKLDRYDMECAILQYLERRGDITPQDHERLRLSLNSGRRPIQIKSRSARVTVFGGSAGKSEQVFWEPPTDDDFRLTDNYRICYLKDGAQHMIVIENQETSADAEKEFKRRYPQHEIVETTMA